MPTAGDVSYRDRDGRPLRFFLAEDGMWRFPLSLDEISPELTAALIDSEDRHFQIGRAHV